MERENKAMAGRQLILIRDPGGGQKEFWTASLCVCVRAIERGEGGGDVKRRRRQREEKAAAPDAHPPPRPFILFHRVRLVSNQKAGGAPFGSARPWLFSFFFPSSLLVFFPPPPPTSSSTFDPLYAPVRRQKIARARQDKEGRSPGKSRQ